MLNLNASKTKIVRGKKVYVRISLATLKSNMISKVRNGYKLKVGYGNKNEIINEDFGGYYDNRDGFAPVKEDLTAIANAITSGEYDSSFESLLNSYRERAEKGKKARKLNLVA